MKTYGEFGCDYLVDKIDCEEFGYDDFGADPLMMMKQKGDRVMIAKKRIGVFSHKPGTIAKFYDKKYGVILPDQRFLWVGRYKNIGEVVRFYDKKHNANYSGGYVHSVFKNSQVRSA